MNPQIIKHLIHAEYSSGNVDSSLDINSFMSYFFRSLQRY